MKKLLLITTALVGFSVAPQRAHADPVSAAIVTALGGQAAIGAIGVAAVQLGVSIGTSALVNAVFGNRQQQAKDPGIKTKSRTAGEETPQSFVLGRYATAGNLTSPYYSFDGESTSTPNYNLIHIYDLGDLPMTGLQRTFVNGEDVAFSVTAETTGAKWEAQTEPYKGDFRMHVYDGTQTSASAWLLEKAGSDPDRPWQTDMVGRGIPYVAAQLEYDQEVWQGGTSFLFELDGIALYDPRQDDTAGGAGAQRWSDMSSWSFGRSAVVMIYDLLRGITLPDGSVYGGGFDASGLPFAHWSAQMDATDPVFDEEGACTDGFMAGYEVSIGTATVGGETPADVVDELLKACAGDIADVGGSVYLRAGAPGLPVLAITDEDILRNKPQDLDPFPGLADAFNGVHAAYPSPSDLWETRDAPPRYDADAEAEDGRRLVGDVKLPAVPDNHQVQRLMAAWLKDARRFRRHTITLPPEGILYRPLQTLSWTSQRNGYDAKLFEIQEMAIDPRTLATTLSLREVDPADYDWSPEGLLPTTAPSGRSPQLGPQALPGFAVAPTTVRDSADAPRRPAIRISWSDTLVDVRSVSWTVRVMGTGDEAVTGTSTDIAKGTAIVSEGILPGETYEVQATYAAPGRPTAPTAWAVVTAPGVRLGYSDFEETIRQDIDAAAQSAYDDYQGAIAARDAAEGHAANAVEAAQDSAAYRDASQAAQTAAETAQGTAEQAETDSAAARDAAQSARDQAATSAQNASTSENNAGQSATAASGSASTAATKADEASTSATAASASADTATSAAGQAESYRDSAATSASNADGSATSASQSAGVAAGHASDAEDAAAAASTSESNAATSETNAGQSASAANTAKNQAQTAKGDAESAATSAASARDTAQGHASDASTSATNAATSENNAGDSADAASQSASTASTKAGEASQSATTATSAKNSAETAEGNALTYRNEAAASRNDADGFAAAASSSAGIAASARDQVLSASGNSTFVMGEVGWMWRSSWGSTRSGYSPLSDSKIVSGNIYTGGKAVSFNQEAALTPASDVPVVAGRTYRLRIRCRALSTGSNGRVHAGVFYGSGTSRDWIAVSGSTVSADDAWDLHEGTFTADGSYPTVLPVAIANYQTSGATLEIDFFELADITDSESIKATLAEDYMAFSDDDQATVTGLINYQSQYGDLRSTVEQSATTSADVEGFAEAFFSLTADINGDNVVGLRAGTWENPDGSGSLLELLGDQVIARGSISTPLLNVGDFTNYLDDGTFEDGSKFPFDIDYTSTTLLGMANNTVHSGSQAMRVNQAPSGTTTVVPSKKRMPVSEGDVVYLACWTNTTNDWVDEPQNGFHFRDQNGNYLGAMPYVTQSGGTPWTKKEVSLAVPAGVTEIYIELRRSDSPGVVFVDDLEFRKKFAGELIVDGTILARHAAFESLAALNLTVGSADIEELAVDTLHIAGRAVTTPSRSFFSGNKSINDAWTPFCNTTIATTGGAVDISASFLLDFLENTDTGRYYSTIEVRVRRDATEVWSSYVSAPFGGAGTTVGFTIVDNPPGGTYTYWLEANEWTNPTHEYSTTISNRFLMCMEFKK